MLEWTSGDKTHSIDLIFEMFSSKLPLHTTSIHYRPDDERVHTAGNSSGEYSVTITLLSVLLVVSSSLLFLVTGLFVRSLKKRNIIQAQEIGSDENFNQTKTTKTETK